MSSPLQGEPERQAIAPIGGFLYQIWQSVLSWIKLEGSEVLYLEGAEDFDVVGHGQATAVQVRHTAALITLGSAKTIKAIEQFWKLREMNPGKKVGFRYLTTSQPGIEAGSPFGQDVSGIDFWERCRKRCEEIEPIKTFSSSKRRPRFGPSILSSEGDSRRNISRPSSADCMANQPARHRGATECYLGHLNCAWRATPSATISSRSGSGPSSSERFATQLPDPRLKIVYSLVQSF